MAKKKIEEENVSIFSYSDKISKKQDVFYNPEMKLNRDISLLVIKSYFERPIKFCDPMIASAIREIRFLKTIPEMFDKMVLGDISLKAIEDAKKNFSENNINYEKCIFERKDAIETINISNYDFIEIDPFGSPVPFLDIACQKVKHNGILSVTATDTAALCGTYPKTTLRKYSIKVSMTHCYEEIGLRNLIAYSIRQAAKYEKSLIPLIAYSNKHYYKVFFKVIQSREKAYSSVKNLSWIDYNYKNQDITINETENKASIGKTYVGNLNDKEFIQKIKSNLNLISNKKEIEKLLEKIENEVETIGHYNPHKLQKEFNLKTEKKFDYIIEKLKETGFNASRPHNNKLGIKTNAKSKDILKIIRE